MTSPNVTIVTDATSEQEVTKSDKPVLIDFYAEWCPPCKKLAPELDQYADENVGKVKVVKVDVDANPKLSAAFNIKSIPTMVMMKDGKEIARDRGFKPKSGIEKFVNDTLSGSKPGNNGPKP